MRRDSLVPNGIVKAYACPGRGTHWTADLGHDQIRQNDLDGITSQGIIGLVALLDGIGIIRDGADIVRSCRKFVGMVALVVAELIAPAAKFREKATLRLQYKLLRVENQL